MFTALFAGMAALPIIPFLLIYAVLNIFVVKNAKTAFGWAANATTVFLIAANISLINLLGTSPQGKGGVIIFMLFAIMTGALGLLQWSKRHEINITRLARAVWRLGFLCLSLLYIILFTAHLGLNMFSS